MPLKRLGPYEIGKPLGKGGMGSVYEATNVDTGERVAVKALTPHLAMAEGFRERFEAEIESLKALRHDGIVRLYGYGEQNGVLFYSMELVEGVSLEDEIKAGRRFNWREVTNIAIQLSLALKHAHDHGIVHRDIKPANILLYGDDRVKLADFGIARLFGTNQLTTAGGVLGTADYMSPEQADGRPVTARCDQYSLGGVMYALLTGRPPFRANNLPQMLQLQRFAQPEPVRRYAPDVPEQLERLIGQLLAKEPTERFPNMQVLARHLQAMVKALSRPTADDFALVGDDHGGKRPDADWGHSISIELTQAESEAPRRQGDAQATTPETPRPAKPGGPSSAQGDVSPQEAATLAAEEMPGVASKPASNGAAAKPQAISRDRVREAPERPTRFTTVEEDEARRQAQQQRSWPLMAAQLGLLGTVLAGMGGLAYYLSLPPSADQLFQAVSSEADLDSPDSLAKVENEVNEFLERYPADPRAPQVQRYQEQLMLDKLERRLLRQVRDGNMDPALLPIERLYMHAMNTAQLAPDSAATMLRSLLDLHPAGVPITSGASGDEVASETAAVEDANARTTAIIQLTERQLAKLEVDIARQNERQLAALRERLEAAGRLTASEPQQAAAMYRAIIDLHEKSAWASEIVAQARERLAELDSRNDR